MSAATTTIAASPSLSRGKEKSHFGQLQLRSGAIRGILATPTVLEIFNKIYLV